MRKDANDKKYREEKPLYRKWQVWILVILVISVCGLGVFCFTNKSTSERNDKDDAYTYEELDVREMIITEACAKIKEQGWEISKIGKSEFDDRDKLDCHNTKYVVRDTEYNKTTKSVVIYYQLPPYDKTQLIGLPVNEACQKVRAAEWKVGYVRQDVPNDHYAISDCNGTEIVTDVSITGSMSLDFYVHTDTPDTRSFSERMNSSSSSTNNSTSTPGASPSSTTTTNPSFRKVMDDYESFMNQYIDFMKKYKNSSDTASMLSDYSKMMQDYAKYAKSIEGYNQGSLSADDWAYYLEVTARVTKKLAEI